MERFSSSSSLPPLPLTGAMCKQRLLLYGNMAAKCCLEDKNPSLSVLISPEGRIQFNGHSLNTDHQRNQYGSTSSVKCVRSGDRDIELSGHSKKMLVEVFDLHGLLVREAIQFVSSVFLYHGDENRMILRFIVGRGNHSAGGVSRLGPALRRFFDGRNISYTLLDGEIRARINS